MERSITCICAGIGPAHFLAVLNQVKQLIDLDPADHHETLIDFSYLYVYPASQNFLKIQIHV